MAAVAEEIAGIEGRGRYRALVFRRLVMLSGLVAALFVSVAVDMALGPANYPLSDVLTALFHSETVSDQLRVVIWDIRMPIALMAVTVGASLSLAGAQMQTILANPLASPFTLGISAAAGFGAALGLVAGVAVFPVAVQYMVPVNAFLMAMVAALFIHFASTMRASPSRRSSFSVSRSSSPSCGAVAARISRLRTGAGGGVFWTMGSLTKATWPKVWVTGAVLLVAVPVFARRAWALTALRLGEDKAASFGINVRRLRLETMLTVSLLAAIPVSFVGTIGFVGLVGPHIARMLVGEDQRFFLPASVLCGALLLSVTSVVSKMLIPGAVLPIGIITALVGVPFFFVLIFTNRKRAW